MLQLYTWSTPNGYKPLIMLHELGLEFAMVPIPLDGSQKSPDYLKINPNGKIPSLQTGRGDQAVTIFESGAILTYLAETHGKFLPPDPASKSQVLEWVFFQNAAIGPMLGQLGSFRRNKDHQPMAIQHFEAEADRLLRILDKRLEASPFLAGADYSIADITTHPWVRKLDMVGIEVSKYPSLKGWIDQIGEREAVQKAYATKFPQPAASQRG